jgi:hypothetical protein
MKVKALREWRDLKEGVTRNEGDVFVVSKQRYEQIMQYRDDLVEPCEEEPAKKALNRKRKAAE